MRGSLRALGRIRPDTPEVLQSNICLSLVLKLPARDYGDRLPGEGGNFHVEKAIHVPDSDSRAMERKAAVDLLEVRNPLTPCRQEVDDTPVE